jgi:hypothetical protein
LSAGAHDTVGARAQIAGDDHCVAGTNIVDTYQIPQPRFDVDISFEVRDVLDETAGW